MTSILVILVLAPGLGLALLISFVQSQRKILSNKSFWHELAQRYTLSLTPGNHIHLGSQMPILRGARNGIEVTVATVPVAIRAADQSVSADTFIPARPHHRPLAALSLFKPS